MLFLANEIVSLAGIDPKVIGKFRVRIGGLSVNKPDHVINVQDAKKVTLLVGVEEVEVQLPELDEPSKAVKAVKKAQGTAVSQRYFDREKSKADAKDVE